MLILDLIRKLLAPPIFEGNEDKTRVAGLLNTVLWFMLLTPLLLLLNAITTPANRPLALPLTVLLTGILTAMVVLLKRGYVRASSVLTVTLVLILLAILGALNGGQPRPVNIFYTLLIVIAGLLLGGRGAIVSAIASAVLLGIVTYGGETGLFTARLQAPPTVVTWATYSAGFVLIGIVLRLSTRSLSLALGRAQKNERELQALAGSLEQRVSDRTREMALAAEVGRSVSQIRELEALLTDAVERIRTNFDLYYTQIFLADTTGNALVMTAGTGTVGADLKRRNFRLPIGPGSLNGTAAAARQDVLVANTAESALFRPNSLLPETRSELAVPLLVGDKVVGVLDMQSSRPYTFSEDNRQAFDSLAGLLAVSIQNIALFAEAQTARAELEEQARRLARSGWENFLDAIHNQEVLQATYEAETPATEGVGAVPHALSAPIKVIGEPVGALRVETTQPWSESDQQLVTAVAEQVARQIENLRLLSQAEQYRTEAEQANRRRTGEGWASFLGSQTATQAYEYDGNQVLAVSADMPALSNGSGYSQPITVRGETIGEITLGGAKELDDSAADLVETVAAQLSTHVENLRLFEQTQKRAAELQTVAQVSATASTTLDTDKLLQSVVDLTKSAFGLYHAHIYLLDETGQYLALAAGAGEAGQKMLSEGWRIPLDRERSLVARAARSREGITENDVRSVPDFLPNPLLPDTRSELAVPLIVGEQGLGVFDVQSEVVGAFTAEDVQIQITLAGQVAVALQNARLYSEQTRTADRLREMDRLKSTFLANMSHELRTPLNSVIGYTDVILEGLDGPLTEPMEVDLKTIQRNGRHLLSLISDVLDMAKIESGKMSLAVKAFDLRHILAEIIDITSPLANERNVELVLDAQAPSLAMEGDEVRLRQVVMNVVNNAIKFTESGGQVAIQAERSNGHIRVQVKDTGIGIPPDKLELVFQEFMQVDSSTTRKVGGTGLGLPISRHLIALHGGRLWAESSGVRGEGSTFTFEVPVESQIGEEN